MTTCSQNKVNLCHMDTGGFVYEIETEEFYKSIAKDVETKFGTSYLKDDKWHLPIGRNTNVIGMIEFVVLRANMYTYRSLNKS